MPCMDPIPTPLADPRYVSRDGPAARDLSGKGIRSRLWGPLPPGPLSSGPPFVPAPGRPRCSPVLANTQPRAHVGCECKCIKIQQHQNSSSWVTLATAQGWKARVASRLGSAGGLVPSLQKAPLACAGLHSPSRQSTHHLLTSALLPTETSALEVLVALRAQDQASGTLCRFEPICPVFSALLFSGALQPYFPFPLARGLCWALYPSSFLPFNVRAPACVPHVSTCPCTPPRL